MAAADSSVDSARRASPRASRASCVAHVGRTVDGLAAQARAPGRRARDRRCCAGPPRRAACSTTTLARESSGALTSNDGFSVVAPTRITVPASTCGSSASCWALLKRWISSMNSSVRSPRRSRRCAASATASRTSFTPDITADSATKAAPASAASRRPSVVLPVPGGPHRISDVSSFGCRARAAASVRARAGAPGRRTRPASPAASAPPAVAPAGPCSPRARRDPRATLWTRESSEGGRERRGLCRGRIRGRGRGRGRGRCSRRSSSVLSSSLCALPS